MIFLSWWEEGSLLALGLLWKTYLHYTVNCCPSTCMELKVEHRQNDLSLEKIKKKKKN